MAIANKLTKQEIDLLKQIQNLVKMMVKHRIEITCKGGNNENLLTFTFYGIEKEMHLI